MIRRPSPTAVVATLALFFALGGTAIAGHHYLITSTAQIKPTILKKLKGAQGAAGVQGPVGPAGATGPAGPSATSAITTVDGPVVEVATEKVGSAEAVCPVGSRAIGGGGSGGIAGIDVSEMETSHQSWFIITDNETGITVKIHAEVQCATAGQAVAARAPRITHVRRNRLVAELAGEVAASKR